MILRVWDNQGKTFDRYTIRIRNSYYGMSSNPNHPQGFCQYCGDYGSVVEGKHLGKLLQRKEYRLLPEEVRKTITSLS